MLLFVVVDQYYGLKYWKSIVPLYADKMCKQNLKLRKLPVTVTA